MSGEQKLNINLLANLIELKVGLNEFGTNKHIIAIPPYLGSQDSIFNKSINDKGKELNSYLNKLNTLRLSDQRSYHPSKYRWPLKDIKPWFITYKDKWNLSCDPVSMGLITYK